MLAVAAALEAAFAICLGCIAYSAIWGCADCDDISDRLRRAMIEAREDVHVVDDPGPLTTVPADAPAMR
jgi:hypothetical protein